MSQSDTPSRHVDDLLDDLESLSPGLESSSSSINSTQENSPLVGPPLNSSDFSIDAATLLLESFQISYEMAHQQAIANSTIAPDPRFQVPANIQHLISTRTPATPSSELQVEPIPVPVTNSTDQTTRPPFFNSPHASSSSSSSTSRGKRNTPPTTSTPSSSTTQNDFFDTDVIINRSGEEETFLRGHCGRFAPHQLPAPDVSKRTNYPSYYLSQDTFLMASVYHSTTVDEEEDNQTAASSSSSRAPTTAAAVEGSGIAGSDISKSFDVNDLFYPTTTTNTTADSEYCRKDSKGKNPQKPSKRHQHISHQQQQQLHSTSSFQQTHSLFPPPSLQTQHSLFPAISSSTRRYQPSPPLEEEFNLFPPIVGSQFDPLYAIPLLPDSAPKEDTNTHEIEPNRHASMAMNELFHL